MISDWLASYPNANTRAAYGSDLAAWIRWCDESDVEPLAARRRHISQWRQEMVDEGARPSTVRRRLASTGSFFSFVLDEVEDADAAGRWAAAGLARRNPVERVVRPRVDRDSPQLGLAAEQARALLVVAESSPNAVDAALVTLLMLDGLRVSEALSLSHGDLGVERGHRVIRYRAKGGVRRTKALPPRTVAAIDRLSATPRSSTDYLFASRKHVVWIEGQRRIKDRDVAQAMSRHSAASIIGRLGRTAGIERRITPHTLRHSYVALALDAGVPLRDVQLGAGHADPATTCRYDAGREQLDGEPGYAISLMLAS